MLNLGLDEDKALTSIRIKDKCPSVMNGRAFLITIIHS